MRISDWSSTCALPISAPCAASTGAARARGTPAARRRPAPLSPGRCSAAAVRGSEVSPGGLLQNELVQRQIRNRAPKPQVLLLQILHPASLRSEEHTSELQSLMRISYAVFCLKKKKTQTSP